MSFPRYESYKESGVEWLGDVPEYWELKRLKRNLRLLTEKTDRRENPVALENIESWSGSFIQTETKFEGDGIAFERGDILFGKLRPYLAKVYLADASGEAVGDFHVMRPTKGIDSRFSQYQILNREFIAIVDGSTFGAKMPRVSWDFLGNMVLTTPPIPEQQTIAAFLDRETAKIDALIAEQQRLIELLKEKRQSVISHAVTKGLNPNAPMKDSGIEWLGDVPEHWEISRLGFESWVRARLGWKGLKAEEYVDDGFAFLSTPNIKGASIDFENVNFINEYRYDESPEIKLRVDDVLLAKDGSTLGIVNIVRSLPRPTTVNSSIAVITPNQSLNGIFLYYLFQSSYMENTIQRIKGGMGVPHLFQGDLNKFYIPLPTIDEQRTIAVFLDSETVKLDTLITEAKTAITLLQERRTALISAAVTGKIDVRGLVSAKTEVKAETVPC
ncbi:MAG: restriction endonuclease subunit S [Deltaproteobacteria bacterium]|nr:restriction endonuclease subunit S [Deltaproteobacteria bacterium]